MILIHHRFVKYQRDNITINPAHEGFNIKVTSNSEAFNLQVDVGRICDISPGGKLQRFDDRQSLVGHLKMGNLPDRLCRTERLYN